MKVAIQHGANELQLSSPESLFKPNGSFDLSADGKRFLVYKDAEVQPLSVITLITNWSHALQK